MANFNIASATADLGSTTGYGLQASSATATITAPYNGASDNVGGLQRTAQGLASYGSPVDNQTVSMVLKSKIAGSTPAGSYLDTVRVIATANF